jgi:hypothetical protein
VVGDQNDDIDVIEWIGARLPAKHRWMAEEMRIYV